MAVMKSGGRKLAALLLCAALLCAAGLPALAAEPKDSFLDSDAISDMVESYLRSKDIPGDRVGIGFCYTATGDEWFYNADTWFYPASMYKVPLMMVLSERVHNGEVPEDTLIGGLPLDTVYEYIIIHSNNDYAHAVRKFLINGQGGDEIWREEAKQYARLDEYDPRYIEYCYFSPRFMTQTLETLFADPDRFPRVLDCMLRADQGHYFRLTDEMHPYKIAQKYGSYLDMENSNWNHTSGIIYTPRPFILTVMTKNVAGHEQVIGQLAALFKDYVLELDEQYAVWEQAEAEQAAEQARLEAEQAEAARAEAEQQVQAQQAEVRQRTENLETQEKASKQLIYSLAATFAGLVVLGILSAVFIPRHKKKKRYEHYRRRFEEELRQEELAGKRQAQNRRRP